MVNLSNVSPYFYLMNNATCGMAFDLTYMSQGSTVYAYSNIIPPGQSRSIFISFDATDIKFRVFKFRPRYEIPMFFSANFKRAMSSCYVASGSFESPELYRVPCFLGNNNGSNSCCNCCSCSCC